MALSLKWKRAMALMVTSVVVLSLVYLEQEQFGIKIANIVQKEPEEPSTTMTRAFCEWNGTVDDCQQLLALELPKNATWVFFGDSTVRQIFEPLVERIQKQDNWTKEIAERPEKNLQFLGLVPKQKWIRPNYTRGEGPVTRVRPRTECMRCHNRFFLAPNRTNRLAMEYLGVEFARDVEYSTNQTDTTQESVALHLRQNAYPNICIVSVGQHDAAIPNITTALYQKNARDYIALLDQACAHVIWLGLNSVLDDPRWPQTNELLYEWNHGVYDLIETDFKHVSVIDAWNASRRMKHFNNVHMGDEYTFGLVDLFQSLMERYF